VVEPDREPPSVRLAVDYNLRDAAGGNYVQAGTEVPVRVEVTDNVGLASLELRIAGAPLPLSAEGSAMVSFPRAGSIDAIALALDLAGNLGSVTNHIPVVDPHATNTVAIVIHSVTNFVEITRPVEIVATITSQEPLSEYRVDYAEWTLSDATLEVAVSDPRFQYQILTNVVLPPGTPQLDQAVLARFDPTLLLNGSYIIRVTAYDLNRQGRQEGAIVTVAGDLKFGELRLEFTDLVIPVAGIPITVKRIYDSREAGRPGDFGYGWTLGIQDAHILEVGKSRYSGLGNDHTTFTANTRVHLTAPDGRRVGFNFAPELSGAAFLYGAFYRPAFKADPGVYDILEPVDTQAAYQFNSRGQFTSLFGLSGYSTGGYRLTTKDNLTYEYDRDAGLKSVTDLNGNHLQYTRDGIFHYAAGSTNVDQSIRFVRDARGRIAQVIDPDGHALQYTYDAAGDLRSFTDQVTNLTQYIYHAARAHYLTNVIDPLGRPALRATYDEAGRLTTVMDAAGNQAHQDFDADRNLGTFTDARGTVTYSQYDDRGNQTTKWLPGYYTNRFEYDANNNLLRGINARGYATNLTYDARGNVTSITDALSNRTAIAYNAQHRPVAITNALGQRFRFSYDRAGKLAEVVNNAGNRLGLGRDAQGRLTSLSDAGGNTSQFDFTGGCACGRPGKVINPDGTFRLYGYTTQGLTNRVVNEVGAESLFEYDRGGRLLWMRDASSNRTTFAYDGPLLASVSDPLGRTTRFAYDELRRTNQIVDAEGGVVRFDYDAVGNRTKVVDPVNNVTTFVYDAANRLIHQIDPLGHTNLFTYDAVGNRIEAIDRNGRRRTFAYDAMNRLTNEVWWEGADVVRSVVFGFNELGVQTHASDPAATYAYRYDSENRLQTVAQTAVPNQTDFALDYTYTANGQVASVTDHWGVTVASVYDARNRIRTRTWSGPGVDPARADFTHDAAGYRIRTDRYADLDGVMPVGTSTNAYTPAGQAMAITHLGPLGQALARYEYTRDAALQVTRWTLNGQLSTFEYDQTGQLTNAQHAVLPSERYVYDANGNRIGAAYVISSNNQLRSDGAFGYGYDAEGNLTARTNLTTGAVTRYAYDHRNRLVTVTELSGGGAPVRAVAFTYDVMNRRLSKTVDGRTIHFLLNRDDAWADLDQSGSVIARYLLGASLDELLARWRSADGSGWYLSDSLGTVRAITDAQGTSAVTIEYSGFGQVLSLSDPAKADRFRFTGREYDDETGLYFYRARYYAPALGRFITNDPLGFEAGDANLYRYARNDPLRFVDAYGTSAGDTAGAAKNSLQVAPASTAVGRCVAATLSCTALSIALLMNGYTEAFVALQWAYPWLTAYLCRPGPKGTGGLTFTSNDAGAISTAENCGGLTPLK